MGVLLEDGDPNAVAKSLWDGNYKAPTPKKAKKSESLDVPAIFDDELSSLGYPDSTRIAMLGNLGRENAWNTNTIFGGHSDPKNAALNRGLFSWQGNRRTQLDNYLAQNGGDWTPSEENVRLQTRFLDNELRSQYPKLHNVLSSPDVDIPRASKALRRYIKYVPVAPYNTPDDEYDVKNNRQWAEKALARGLGVFNPNKVAQKLWDDPTPVSDPAPSADAITPTSVSPATSQPAPEDLAKALWAENLPESVEPPVTNTKSFLAPSGEVVPIANGQPVVPVPPLAQPDVGGQIDGHAEVDVPTLETDPRTVTAAVPAPPISEPPPNQTPSVLESTDPSKLFAGNVRVAQPKKPEKQKHYGADSGVISDIPETQPLQPVDAKNALNAVSDTLTVPKDLNEEQAKAYVRGHLAAKYGGGKFDDFQFLDGYHPGNAVNVTYGDLQSAGININPLISQKVAERRTEEPTPDLRVGKDFTKEDAERLNQTFGPTIAAAIGGAIAAGGHTANAVAGLIKVINELSPTKMDSMLGAAKLKPYRPGQDVVDYLKGIGASTGSLAANTGEKYQDVATDEDGAQGYLPGRPIEKETWATVGGKALGGLADLPRIAVIPGGPIVAFGSDAFLQSAAEGDSVDWDKAKIEAAKNGSLGALAMIAPGVGSIAARGLEKTAAKVLLEEGVSLGTVGGGTYVTSRAFGDSPEDAFKNAVVFSAFHLMNTAGKAITNIPVRVKDEKGNEAVIKIDEKGEVKTLDPETEAQATVAIPDNETNPEVQSQPAPVDAKPLVQDEPVKVPDEIPVNPPAPATDNTAPAVSPSGIAPTVSENGIAPETQTEKPADAQQQPVAPSSLDLEGRHPPPKPEIQNNGRASKIGKSIEQKAIENNLTESFGGTAEYSPTTVKRQAELAADVLADPKRVDRIIAGEEELPEGLRGASFIKAVEDKAQADGDAGTLRNLAQSKLTSDTSAYAQEMRMMKERLPDSATVKLRELSEARKQAAQQRLGKVSVDEAMHKEIQKIKDVVKITRPRRQDWKSFIEEITCKT